MDNINMQELISFINWEELRIWLLFLFGIIGGVSSAPARKKWRQRFS